MSAITSVPASASHQDISPDDLLAMDGLFELVDGKLIEKFMSFRGGKTLTKVITVLSVFVDEHKLGEVVPEVMFKCFPEKPNQVRRPDIAFITAARMSGVPDEGLVPVRPDLAIEIISPGDEVFDLDEKLGDYESAGIPLVWIFNPSRRTIRVIRPGQPTVNLRATDQLSGEDIVPGFSVRVADLFPH